MAIYRFNIRKHIRDDMYKSEFVDVELSDSEYRNINNDTEKYAKTSALISNKLGEQVQANGFPTIVTLSIQTAKKQKGNRKSFWKPWWAIPFKLIWLIIKMPLKLFS